MRMRSGLGSSVIVACAALGSVGHAGEFTEARAIGVAKAATAKDCSQATPCTFKAQRQDKLWRVYVGFTKRNSPNEAPFPYPGGFVEFLVDDYGKIVHTDPGE